ncbi:UNVERIFIED_CONTAM: hypothetical protein Sradi_0766000 [Sesamum radiatum]|uniref:Reverse transcriptase zinc-binding domain-containing protein n=1 Tax=Sesamum radiatum TaxID=300843 RepID=A0AAW2VTF0_SESRA
MALLARVLWNIHRKADTLWVQWVNGVYLRGVSVWDWQSKKGDSPLLQRLAVIRNKIVTTFGSSEAAIQHIAGWYSSKGLETSKAHKYFRPKCIRQPWHSAIWKAFIPPKYSFILWLGLRGRLSTLDRLTFLQEDESCSLCINTQESAKYLFFECPFSDFVLVPYPALAWHQPMYVHPSHRGEMAKEGEDGFLHAKQSETRPFGMHGLQPLEALKRVIF